jgi:hypothetical protein
VARGLAPVGSPSGPEITTASQPNGGKPPRHRELEPDAGLHKECARRTHVYARIVVAGTGEVRVIEHVLHPGARRVLLGLGDTVDVVGPAIDVVTQGVDAGARLSSQIIVFAKSNHSCIHVNRADH